MKPILLIPFVLCLAGLIASTAQNPSLIIRPEKPQGGENVTLLYTPEKSSDLSPDKPAFHSEVYIIATNDEEKAIHVPLSFENKCWQGTFILPLHAMAMLVRIRAGELPDRNDPYNWNFVVYGKDQKPVYEANAILAGLTARGEKGILFSLSPEERKSALMRELYAYPDNVGALSYKWAIMLTEKKDDETVAQVRKELLGVWQKADKKDERSLFILLNVFEKAGLGKRGRKIMDSLIAVNPHGYLAFRKKERAIRANPQASFFDYRNLLDDFPGIEKSDREWLYDPMIKACKKPKD